MRLLALAGLLLLAPACRTPMGSTARPREPFTVVLGIAQDGGVPQAGSFGDPRWDQPDERRRVVSLGIVDPASGRRWMVDATPDFRDQLLALHRAAGGPGRPVVDGILLTHAHDDARLYNVSMKAPVHLYAERTVLDDLARIYDHIFRPHRNVNKSFVADVVTHAIEPGSPVALFGIEATPVRLLHGALPIVGWRFDAPGSSPAHGAGANLPIAYCTDVNGIPPESWPRLQGLDVLVLDMLRERAHPTHFSLGESLAAAERLGARRTVFTHMTHDVRHAELAGRLPVGVELGYDGLRL